MFFLILLLLNGPLAWAGRELPGDTLAPAEISKTSSNDKPWDFDSVSELSLFPEYSRSDYFPEQKNIFFTANSKLRLRQDDVSFEIQPELRTVEALSNLTQSQRDSVRSPSRWMHVDYTLNSTPQNEAILTAERLNFNYHTESFEMTLGRKPVSLGVVSIFPVWNKFSRPFITNTGPLRFSGQDQALFRYQHGSFALQALDIEQGSSSDATRIGEAIWYGEDIELHALGGVWWDAGTAGLAAVKDLAGTALRFEGLWFSGHGIQASLGGERALDKAWSVLTEFLYLEEGTTDKNRYLVLPQSRFRILSAKYYGFAQAEYKPWPLWTFQLGALVNLIDGSQVGNFKFLHSLSDNGELSFEIRLPNGESTSELSSQTLPLQILAGLKQIF